MIEEEFQKLSGAEQENFKKLVNLLLGRTYLLREVYSFDDNMRRSNPEYRFVDRNFALFNEYLALAGFQLERDSNYGVISLHSDFDYNRQKFDKLTTLMLYTLRLIYEEGREKIALRPEIFTSTGELIHKMLSLGILKKKPAARDILAALRQLGKFNILEKMDGKWEDAATRLLILPTVLFIVSNEKIGNMYDLMESDAAQEDETSEFDEFAAEEEA